MDVDVQQDRSAQAAPRPPGRRRLIVLAGAVLALLALVVTLLTRPGGEDEPGPATEAGGPPPVTAQGGDGGAVPVPERGAYLGTHFSKQLPDRQGAITGLEEQLGRKFDVDHVYYRWDAAFPGAYDEWTAQQGRLLFLNWTSLREDGEPTMWADIAAGREDDVIAARAETLKRFGRPILLGFTHEPGALISRKRDYSGTTEDYIAAWRHLTQRFEELGVTNVSWVWTLTSFQFRKGEPEAFYPGDDVVDWIGVDGYSNIPCPGLNAPWIPWKDLFADPVEFAREHGKPLIVAEFGVGEDEADPERKARWYREAAEAIADTPEVKAVVSFNSEADCSEYAASSPASAQGYRDLVQAPAVQPQLPGR